MPDPARGRPPYPEQAILPIPTVIFLCQRCKGALVWQAPFGFPRCDTCGNEDRREGGTPNGIGHAYIRVATLRELFRTEYGSDEWEGFCSGTPLDPSLG